MGTLLGHLEYTHDHTARTVTPAAAGRDFYGRGNFPPSPGLPDGVTRWEVLKLLKGARKSLGLGNNLLVYLEFLIARTFDHDWLAGQIPVVYASVKSIAQALNVSEKQINNYERSLARLGLLTWRDSGNRRRYGKRNKQNVLQFAFGPDLTPLIERYAEIVEKATAERLELQLRNDRLAVIHSCRRLLKDGLKMAASWGRDNAVTRAAAGLLRTLPRSFPAKLTAAHLCEIALELDDMCRRLRETLKTPPTLSGTDESSDQSEQNFRLNTKIHPSQIPDGICNELGAHELHDAGHGSNESPLNRPSPDGDEIILQTEPAGAGGMEEGGRAKPRSRAEPPEDDAGTGIEHVTIDHVMSAASEMMQEIIRDEAGQGAITWAAIARASDRAADFLGISPALWKQIRQKISPAAAAVCVVIAERRLTDPVKPVRNAGGFVRGMMDRAESGTLRLHRSIFGLSRRPEFQPQSDWPDGQADSAKARGPAPASCQGEPVPAAGMPAGPDSPLPLFSATREVTRTFSS
ncbi:hypothetical protein FMN50_02025 [Rhodobacterales bacterium]|nr:hypothetical protein FMN50_02025 [Rhodobacterales bacterium]